MPTRSGPWRTHNGAQPSTARQGWKVHLSSRLADLERVLVVAHRVAESTGLTYKAVAGASDLLALNGGNHGLAQIGKDVVFYPHDDAGFVIDLVHQLDRELAGVQGPAVTGEYRIRASRAPIHLRYGAFDVEWGTTPEGMTFPAIIDPDGIAVPDVRGRPAPAWAMHPDLQQLVVRDAVIGRMLDKRFLIVEPMPFSGKADLFLAIDANDGGMCVAKRSRRFYFEDSAGGDALQDSVVEAQMLHYLGEFPFAPAVRAFLELGDEAWLIMDAISGTRLDRWVQHPNTDDDRNLVASRIVNAFDRLHERGVVHGDVSTANILIDDALMPWLIDFGTALRVGDRRLRDFATPGYYVDAKRTNTATVGDDVYGMGAALWAIETGLEPSLLPQSFVTSLPWRLLGRANSPMTAAIDERLGTAWRVEPPDQAIAVGQAVSGVHEAAVEHVAEAWRRAALVPVQHFTSAGHPSSSLDSGNAGMLLALVDSAGSDIDVELLVAGARAISNAPQDAASRGLLHGSTGVHLLALGVGVRALDERLVEESVEQLLRSFAAPAADGRLDFYAGSAGELRGALAAHTITGEGAFIEVAHGLATKLLESVDSSGLWRVTAGPATGRRWMLGFAHGAAGIADTLLDYWTITGEPDIRRVLDHTVGRLAAAFTTLSVKGDQLRGDQRNLEQVPEVLELAASSWCNGWAGVVGFLTRYARSTGAPVDLELGGLPAAYRPPLDRLPVFCHGAAGALNAFAALREAGAWLPSQIGDTMDLLVARAVWGARGATFASDDGSPAFPGFLTGYGGIPAVLKRVVAGGPEPLSVAHFVSVAFGMDGSVLPVAARG